MITLENSSDKLQEYKVNPSGDTTTQAAAWNVIHDYCVQRGMRYENQLTGIETVILFLETSLENKSIIV